MDCVTSDQQRQLISSFVDIAVGQTVETAIHFLNATSWYLEDAINLFLIARRNPNHTLYYKEVQTPRPSPSMMDTSMYHTSEIWVGPQEYLASLTSNKRIKTEKVCFSSNDAYDQDMSTFWDDDFVVSGEEKTDTFSPDRVHEEETCLSSDLFEFPVLTEEPKEDCDRSLLCSLCVRFPDGRRKQRKFFKTEPIQLLWCFSYSLMDESEKRAFKLVQAIPGASKTLDYGAKATFDQSGIANSIISVTWE